MNYIKAEDLRQSIEEDSKEYILLDVRKLEDYKECHIKGSYSSDQDAATKAGDNERGRKNLKRALEEVKEREEDRKNYKYVLVCYAGGPYAEKTRELMLEIGISEEVIYILKDGINKWKESGIDYTRLLER